MEKEFQTAYKQLNTAQKQAVDAIEGPVLVVAGPGTGKTQLLSLRVANILHKTDTDPGSVLCLTFTNFAATNMRDRLSRLVGPSAHNVMVRTFHSFAAEIMNMYPDYFWNGARLQIAPDAVQLEIVQDILSELPLDNPLAMKFAGAYTALSDVQQALRLSKEAGLTPEKLRAMLAINEAYIALLEPQLAEILSAPLSVKKLPGIKAEIDKLPDQEMDETITPLTSLSTVLKDGLARAIESDIESGKTTQTGKWKRQWIQTVNGEKGMFDEKRRNAWWLALADVYASYRDRLHGHGYYDYSDMIVEVITQLEQQPELLASVQERFLYVLIDEFQDTNAAQLRLAHLVATHVSTEGKPNLMAVGDDDQSIFAFNGAELNNMLTFRRTYPATQTIVLIENYRSTQSILDTAQSVIDQAEDRLVKREPDLIKNLEAKASVKPGNILHLQYPTRQHELSALANRVKQEWQNSQEEQIAVLARGHDSLRQLSALLTKQGVPIRYEQQNNIFDQPLVQQVCLLAEIVEAIRLGDEVIVNHNLAVLLQHPVWGISAQDLWKMATANYRDPHWLDSLLKHSDQHIKVFGEWLLWLSEQAATEPLPVLIEHFLGLRAGSQMTSPLRDYFISLKTINNTYLEGLSAMQVLRDNLNEFVASGAGQATLSDFVRFIHLHTSLDRTITDESWFMTGEEAVQLMTVHKAKGLEFDTVFLLDAVEDNWRPRHIGRKPPANLPLQPYGEQYDDYVRLLYVATTRAKHSLVVGSYKSDGQGRSLLATPLITSLPLTEIQDEAAGDSVEVLEQSLAWPRLESQDEKALLRGRLTDYRLSPTALLQFLDLTTGGPQHFLERQLLRLPDITTPNMVYGTATHRALQTAQQLVNTDKFDLEAVLEAYETSLGQQQLPLSEHKRYVEYGRQLLTRLFNETGFGMTKGAQPEIGINDLQVGSARLSGKLDLLDLKDNELTIYDYKTGAPLTSFETRDQTKVVKAWRHRNQLLFYALLAARSGRYKSAKTISAQMVYVEADNPKQLRLGLQPDQDSLDRLQRLIEAVWRHVRDLNFPDTSRYDQNIDGIQAFEADLLAGKI